MKASPRTGAVKRPPPWPGKAISSVRDKVVAGLLACPPMPAPSPCFAVIPCFNEAASIAGVVRGVAPLVAGVIVVDDGSTDATAASAQAAGATVLRHAGNRGKGAALLSGARRARELGATWLLFLDGDGQHDPADATRLLGSVEGEDLLIGDRMAGAAGMTPLRRVVNRFLSRDLGRHAGRDIPDSQCGLRLIRLAAWGPLALPALRFEVESEMILAAVAAGLRVGWVPVPVRARAAGRSQIRPLHDTWRWWRWRRDAWRRYPARPAEAAAGATAWSAASAGT